VKFRKSREVEGRILSVTVTRTPTGKLEASILCEVDVQPLRAAPKQAVGLDLGLKSYLTPSEGEPYDNPRHYRTALKKLRKAGKALSRRTKGSSGWKRAKTKLARVHERISNLRHDFLHKLSTSFVRTFGVIAVEDLRVANMAKNRRLARSVMDAGWGEFVRQLEYKSAWYGRTLVKVGAFFPSSQMCHDCGFQNPAVKDLSVREWTCLNCGETHDRDLNAALNIRDEGLRIVAAGMAETKNACGDCINPALAGSGR